MQYTINRNGKKIVLTQDEIAGILIKKEYSDLKEAFAEVAPDDLFPLYLFLAKGKTKAFEKIDDSILNRVLEISGTDSKQSEKEEDNLDKIRLDFLEDEEE